MVLPALCYVKGGANAMWALVTLEKYERTNYDEWGGIFRMYSSGTKTRQKAKK